MGLTRLFVLPAGLCGAAGIILSALAAHTGASDLDHAAQLLLVHAPALLVLGLCASNRIASLGGLGLLVGVVLFSGDLIMRHGFGTRLFPMAAPMGGLLMMFGWLAIAVSCLRRGSSQA